MVEDESVFLQPFFFVEMEYVQSLEHTVLLIIQISLQIRKLKNWKYFVAIRVTAALGVTS